MKFLGYFEEESEMYTLSDHIIRVLSSPDLVRAQVIVKGPGGLIMLFGPDDCEAFPITPHEALMVLQHPECYPVREGRVVDYRLRGEHEVEVNK